VTLRRPVLLVTMLALAVWIALAWREHSRDARARSPARSASSRVRAPNEGALDRDALLRSWPWLASPQDGSEPSPRGDGAGGADLGLALFFGEAGSAFAEEVVTLPASPSGVGGTSSSSSLDTGGSPSGAQVAENTEGREQVPSESEPEPQPERPVLRSPVLQVWTQTGLCAEQLEASEEVRGLLKTRFRVWEGGERGRFFLDPRLPDDARVQVLAMLDRSEAQVQAKLKLAPARPDVFVYKDAELLRAAACVNDGVIAYYDGALHLAIDDRDLAASVTHELAHHALMSSGLRGPAWAQEGLAMHAADERWWMRPAQLAKVTSRPFSLEQMEEIVPYKLVEEQSITFYVQAAAMVGCILVRKRMDLAGVVDALQNAVDSLAEVRELFEPEDLEACVREGR
jgi:hypothetical protein